VASAFWKTPLTPEPIIVGLTPARTQGGVPHIDGGACCVTPDGACAVAEERLTRRKHSGGSAFALRAVLAHCGVCLQDVDHFYISTCGEPAPPPDAPVELAEDGIRLLDMGVPANRITWIDSHHLSHAQVALETSGLDRAVVVVMDDAGSAPAIGADGPKSPAEIGVLLERSSAFIANAGALKRVASIEAPSPSAGSYGTMYRCMTDYIGLSGLTESGKAMALSAYGSSTRFTRLDLMKRSGIGHVTRLRGSPHRSTVAVTELLRESGYPVEDHGSGRPQDMMDLARRAQDELESSVAEFIRNLIAAHGVSNVCLAGGVALNCILNGKIADMPEVSSVHIPSAPHDTGQPLGNCLIGLKSRGLPAPDALRSPFLGPAYGRARTHRACSAWAAGFAVTEGDVAARAAQAIASGKVVAIYHGRSELGPRALGHRSILADPSSPTMKDYLNRHVKGREWYRPYGAAILAEHVVALTGRQRQSAEMMIALRLVPEWRQRLSAVCHVDGTCRIQTVKDGDCHSLRAILTAFHALSGIPALLNTSFNAAGKPIVETPEDALAAFVDMPIDALAIEDLFIEKPDGGINSAIRVASAGDLAGNLERIEVY
jgi:carbamoyltransferase